MDQKMSIRRATLDDCHTIARLGAETFTETFGHLYDPKDLELFIATSHSAEANRSRLEEGGAGWLALDDQGHDLGFSMVGPCALPVDPMPDRAGELTRLYVRQSAQGTGLGNRLLSQALDWMDEKYDQHYLSVFSENPGAQRLYHRYGFEKIKEYDYMVGHHADLEYVYQRKNKIRP